jgi:serine/threonine protein kinase
VSDESPWPAAGFPAGARVAGYRLDEQIGRGGMAVVYRAYDLQLDRQVALKILDPALAADREFQQRFIRESKAAAAVDHPHIIPVFAAGQALVSRTYGELAAVTDGIPARLAVVVGSPALSVRHARKPVRTKVAGWTACLIIPATLGAAFLTYYGGFFVLFLVAFTGFVVSSKS